MTDNVSSTLTDLWRSIVLFAPKFVAFLVILLVGWLIAKAIGKAVDKVLERVGFDRAVERGGIEKALARSRYDASTIVGKLVYYALLLFVLQLAFGVFGPNPISDLITGVIAFLPKAIVAIIIVVVAAAIAAAVRDLIGTALGGLSYGRVLATIASVFILGLGIIAALNQVGIATTVTTPVLITVLATIGGILVVGVGGGLVRPMQSRWEQYLERMSHESGRIREQVQQSSRREQAGAVRDPYDPYEAPAGAGAAGSSSWSSTVDDEVPPPTRSQANDDVYQARPAGGSAPAGGSTEVYGTEGGYDPRH
jgi:hypothetical protein